MATNELLHSYKNTEWTKHKYVYKKGGRYYYSEEAPAETDDNKYSKFLDKKGNEDVLREQRFVTVQNAKLDIQEAYSKTKIAQVLRVIDKFMHTPIVDFFKKG